MIPELIVDEVKVVIPDDDDDNDDDNDVDGNLYTNHSLYDKDCNIFNCFVNKNIQHIPINTLKNICIV